MSKTTVVVLPIANVTPKGDKIFALEQSRSHRRHHFFRGRAFGDDFVYVLYLPHRFADLGALIEQFNQF